jgi:vancomycin resistance protein YoaR
MTLLGTWTVHFIPSSFNGNGANILTPARKFNGRIIQPGAIFDFTKAVQPVTSPPYQMGAALRHGRIVENAIIGGGMCSASTTLFNAAARAGLDVIERHAHAIYISRYPVGLDATVWDTGPGNGQDMIFSNDTGNPIMIKGIPGRRKVTFQIWGVDDGRTVTLSDPQITNERKADTYMEYTDDLAPGVTKKMWDPYDAFDSVVIRTVKDAQGNVIHRDTFHSSYAKLDGVIDVGRYPDDPPAGTLVLLDDYIPHP